MFKKHILKIFLAIITVLALITSLRAGQKSYLKGKVMQVKDGDTVVIAPEEGGAFFTCRLYGIDAPEVEHKGKPGQAFGEEAKRELKKLVLGQTVEVELTGAKTYNREVCIIYKEKLNVNLEMVKRGYAWAYRKYLNRPYASEYIEAENEARRAGRGLWNQINPTPPWEWRRLTK